MKIRKGFTFWEVVVVLVIVGILAAILFPILPNNRARHSAQDSACFSNLKMVSLALIQYRDDYDERFPPTRNPNGGWMELALPYARNENVFRCPKTKNAAPNTTDYALNSRVAGLELEKFENPANTFLIFDGASKSPPDFAVSQLPKSWKAKDFPAMRHRWRTVANYAFADGHVKWLKPEKVTLENPDGGNYTFLPNGKEKK